MKFALCTAHFFAHFIELLHIHPTIFGDDDGSVDDDLDEVDECYSRKSATSANHGNDQLR